MAAAVRRRAMRRLRERFGVVRRAAGERPQPARVFRGGRGRRRQRQGRHVARLAQLAQDVVDPRHQRGTVAQERVAAPARRAIHAPGDRAERLAEIARKARGDETAAVHVRLDHDHRADQRSHDAVTLREALAIRRPPERELAEHPAALPHPGPQRTPLRRVGQVEAVAEHRDRPAVGVEGALMRRGVDAPRQAAHDPPARGRELTREPPGQARAVGGAMPRTDDRHRAFAGERGALRVQDERRIPERRERERPIRGAVGDHAEPERLDARQLRGPVEVPRRDRRGEPGPHALDAGEFGRARPQRGRQVAAERVAQAAHRGGAHAGQGVQEQALRERVRGNREHPAILSARSSEQGRG